MDKVSTTAIEENLTSEFLRKSGMRVSIKRKFIGASLFLPIFLSAIQMIHIYFRGKRLKVVWSCYSDGKM